MNQCVHTRKICFESRWLILHAICDHLCIKSHSQASLARSQFVAPPSKCVSRHRRHQRSHTHDIPTQQPDRQLPLAGIGHDRDITHGPRGCLLGSACKFHVLSIRSCTIAILHLFISQYRLRAVLRPVDGEQLSNPLSCIYPVTRFNSGSP